MSSSVGPRRGKIGPPKESTPLPGRGVESLGGPDLPVGKIQQMKKILLPRGVCQAGRFAFFACPGSWSGNPPRAELCCQAWSLRAAPPPDRRSGSATLSRAGRLETQGTNGDGWSPGPGSDLGNTLRRGARGMGGSNSINANALQRRPVRADTAESVTLSPCNLNQAVPWVSGVAQPSIGARLAEADPGDQSPIDPLGAPDGTDLTIPDGQAFWSECRSPIRG
jgi:hypothetical protein